MGAVKREECAGGRAHGSLRSNAARQPRGLHKNRDGGPAGRAWVSRMSLLEQCARQHSSRTHQMRGRPLLRMLCCVAASKHAFKLICRVKPNRNAMDAFSRIAENPGTLPRQVSPCLPWATANTPAQHLP